MKPNGDPFFYTLKAEIHVVATVNKDALITPSILIKIDHMFLELTEDGLVEMSKYPRYQMPDYQLLLRVPLGSAETELPLGQIRNTPEMRKAVSKVVWKYNVKMPAKNKSSRQLNFMEDLCEALTGNSFNEDRYFLIHQYFKDLSNPTGACAKHYRQQKSNQVVPRALFDGQGKVITYRLSDDFGKKLPCIFSSHKEVDRFLRHDEHPVNTLEGVDPSDAVDFLRAVERAFREQGDYGEENCPLNFLWSRTDLDFVPPPRNKMDNFYNTSSDINSSDKIHPGRERILILSGIGKGITVLQMLVQLEEQSGLLCASIFDKIVASGTGAIFAFALSELGWTASELLSEWVVAGVKTYEFDDTGRPIPQNQPGLDKGFFTDYWDTHVPSDEELNTMMDHLFIAWGKRKSANRLTVCIATAEGYLDLSDFEEPGNLEKLKKVFLESFKVEAESSKETNEYINPGAKALADHLENSKEQLEFLLCVETSGVISVEKRDVIRKEIDEELLKMENVKLLHPNLQLLQIAEDEMSGMNLIAPNERLEALKSLSSKKIDTIVEKWRDIIDLFKKDIAYIEHNGESLDNTKEQPDDDNNNNNDVEFKERNQKGGVQKFANKK